MMINLFSPYIGNDEEKIVSKVLKSKFWASGAGVGYVKQFEESFKKYVKSSECVAVNSGTAALNLSLSLIDIRHKEVILPSLTFVSTAHAISLNGGKPVFVDVEPNSLCIDPEKIKKAITSKTKVILPVHFAGMPANLDEIQNICKENNLELIEDAAHAAGSSYHGKKIGSHGSLVCFSFHPVKNLAMPNGGLIAINNSSNKKLKESLSAKRWCGISNRKNFSYDVKEMGWNYYMNEFSAAIGLVQLKKLNMMNNLRRKIAKEFDQNLETDEKIPFSKDCNYHIYWILVKNRKKFMKNLLDEGIETGIHYRPIHTMSLYKSDKLLSNTEKIANEIVSIPIHPSLSDKEIEKIIKKVNQYI